MLAAGVALSFAAGSVVPSFAQNRGSNYADVTTQRTTQSPYQGTVVEDIVAMVDDQAISKSDYDRALHEMDQEAQQQGRTQQQLMEQRRDLLRSLIDKQLMLAKGKDLGINGETEVVKRLDEMRKQMNLETMEDLERAAEAQGAPPDADADARAEMQRRAKDDPFQSKEVNYHYLMVEVDRGSLKITMHRLDLTGGTALWTQPDSVAISVVPAAKAAERGH